MEPIGFFHCKEKHPYDQPRQGVFTQSQSVGRVILSSGRNFEQALKGIEGFERIWLVYGFHHNQNWKPMVQPPRGSDKKQGVFATRAPYRPNAIGLSAVSLLAVKGLTLEVGQYDLLDETPIWDIKPYIPEADAFPQSKRGWLEEAVEEVIYTVVFAPGVLGQMEEMGDSGQVLKGFLQRELEYQPLNDRCKRVSQVEEGLYEIAYRLWRAKFTVSDSTVEILKLYCVEGSS